MFSARDEQFGRLLQSAYRDFNGRALKKMREYDYKDLTQFQAELMSYVELDGSRIKSLVVITQTTKQAVGETAAALVKAGYLKKVSDPTDGRVQCLHFTAKGEQFLLDAHRIRSELEQEYIALLGRQDFERLLKTLQFLATHKN